MTFEPGNSYYVLTPGEYETLAEFMGEYEGDSFLSDFTLVDGSYYAPAGSIDSEESQFLEDWRLGNILEYKKSTQSTSFFD